MIMLCLNSVAYNLFVSAMGQYLVHNDNKGVNWRTCLEASSHDDKAEKDLSKQSAFLRSFLKPLYIICL